MATFNYTFMTNESKTTSNAYFVERAPNANIPAYSTVNSVTGYVTVDTTVLIAASLRIQLSSGTGEPNGTVIVDYGDCLRMSDVSKTFDMKSAFYLSGKDAGYLKNTYITVCCKGTYRTYTVKNFSYTLDYTPSKTVFNVTSNNTDWGTVSGGGTWNNVVTNSAETIFNKTITATPKEGCKFVKWTDGNTNATRTITVSNYDLTGATTTFNYQAIFEREGINNIYIGTTQPKAVYIGTTPVKEIYVGTTLVYSI